MRVIWARHPISAAEVIAKLREEDASWHPKTARTLLARLVEKGALSYESDVRKYHYAPLVSEGDCVAAASGSFLERVFGGSLKPMLAHFVSQQKLSRSELDELKSVLEESAKQSSRKEKRR